MLSQRQLMINELTDAGYLMEDNKLLAILTMQDSRFQNFTDILHTLKKNNLLDTATILLALTRTTLSMTSTEATAIYKVSTYYNVSMKLFCLPYRNTTRTAYKLNDNIIFFTETHRMREQSMRGGTAIIKKGYLTEEALTPYYSIKKFRTAHAATETMAKREVKYHHLLGREAFWFIRNNHRIVVAKWQPGISLADIELHLIKCQSFQQRMQMAACALNDVNKLHQQFHLHGDIKPDNFIINTEKNTLSLIDFGSTRKFSSNKIPACTLAYADKQPKSLNRFSSDLYSMGFVIAALFPEYFNFTDNKETLNITIAIINNPCMEERAINLLVDAMMESNPDRRCTSLSALHYCQSLATLTDTLNETTLQHILTSTLNHADYQIEDILRFSKRPRK